jgi:beta-mannosidase
LRHWGGAICQRDEFFQLADERGILVFMEFSFANANYPVGQPLLAAAVTSSGRPA